MSTFSLLLYAFPLLRDCLGAADAADAVEVVEEELEDVDVADDDDEDEQVLVACVRADFVVALEFVSLCPKPANFLCALKLRRIDCKL